MAGSNTVSEDDGRVIAATIVEELARRRQTRQALADSARLSLSTLEKALSGRRPFTIATVVRIEDALGLTLRTSQPRPSTNGRSPAAQAGHAPEDLGSYTRPAIGWIEGNYVTLRPSFSDRAAIYAYRTEIGWDDTAGHMTFREAERTDADFTQFGAVSVPHQSGHIYLVTNRHGQYRLVMLARPTIGGEMHGLLTTLQVGRGAHLTPVSTPIAMAPIARFSRPAWGRIAPGHAAYGDYRRLLRRTVDEPFAILLPA
jgi:hypothetical protein